MSETTTPAQLLIADLMKSTVKTAWLEFKEGISFELKFVSKSKFRLITDQCTTLQFDPRSKVHQPKVDTTKMVELFVKEAVHNWRGATPRRLALIAPVNLESLSDEQKDAELVFSYEQLVALVKETYELDSWMQEAAMDIRCFNVGSVPKEDVAKN